METKGVAVIGAGPAGMFAALKAAEAGAAVTLFEKNEKVGRKLAITGKGRCNVTNDCAPAEVISHAIRGGKFLYSSVFRFPPRRIMDFFEDAGVPLKTERGNRVFPASDRAYDVVDALRAKLISSGVRLRTSCPVLSVLKTDGGYEVKTHRAAERFRSVVVATGGISYPLTGSTGDGYEFARAAGLPVVDPFPSLVPIETAEDFSALSGLTLKNVALTVRSPSGCEVFSRTGEMLFAHFGVTGPIVLSATASMRDHPTPEYEMEVDLKPAVAREEFDERLRSVLSESSAKDLINALRGTAPAALIPYIIKLSGADPRRRAGEVDRATRLALLSAYKAFRLTPTRFRPIDEAIVTAGGVDLRSLDPKTMEARESPGLFFAGEVVDADAYTGGFNLQIAFSTGAAAGEAAARRSFE
ncbi:MAG: aminoacetone oxidase family FAD-binding enzyme [Clostridia bacterium]|nr:aminoacetone oxidase family FAD-binding enzyme [Clostridia bacterium]